MSCCGFTFSVDRFSLIKFNRSVNESRHLGSFEIRTEEKILSISSLLLRDRFNIATQNRDEISTAVKLKRIVSFRVRGLNSFLHL